MALPLIPLAGAALLRVAPTIGRFALRGGWWTTKQAVTQPIKRPITTLVATGALNKATDGAVGEVLLSGGEVAADAISTVVGRDNAASAGRTVLGAAAYAGEGLTGIGMSAGERYGPDTVDAVMDSIPLGLGRGFSAARMTINNGETETADTVLADNPDSDLQNGNIQVPDALRPTGQFQEESWDRFGDSLDNLGDSLGGLFSQVELAEWTALAAQEAKSNRFIQAGLVMGGVTGMMSGNGALGKGFHATKNAFGLALFFGAIGHYLFGQNSQLVSGITNSVMGLFDNSDKGKTPAEPATQMATEAPAAPYMPTVNPQQPQQPRQQYVPSPAMAPVPSMG